MDSIQQLQSYSNDLVVAVGSLAASLLAGDVPQSTSAPFTPVDTEARQDVHRAKAKILSSVAQIKALVCGPTDFVKHLASQCEILACLRWFGEFQILACIPLKGNVLVKDVADLSGVPEAQLHRVIRLTATVGFLHESKPGYVGHTPLSAPFVSNPSFLDAAMFLAESAAPAALQMATATQRFADPYQPNETAYNLAFNTLKPFYSACEERPKLTRQWTAYLHHAGGLHATDSIADIFTQLHWFQESSANSSKPTSIVEVNCKSASTARTLARLYPGLHFVVQINPHMNGTRDQLKLSANYSKSTGKVDGDEDTPGVTVTTRAPGSPQTVVDAPVYILHLPSPSAMVSELQVHLSVLRASGGVMLILTAQLLPEPGSIPNPEVEAMARSRDLAMLQLANEGEMEMGELMGLIGRVGDCAGMLVVTNKLYSRDKLVVALAVKYQLYADPPIELQPALD